MTTQVIPELPPLLLIESCDAPEFVGSTYGDVVLFVPRMYAALDQCNADKTALQQWRSERQKTMGPSGDIRSLR